MLDGYDAHCTEPSYFHAQESDLIEYEPVMPELSPIEQGVRDGTDGTPDWIRIHDASYRTSLVKTMAAIVRQARTPGRMTNVTKLSYEDAWAMSGAPEGDDEW
jgi:hypothetical protein